MLHIVLHRGARSIWVWLLGLLVVAAGAVGIYGAVQPGQRSGEHVVWSSDFSRDNFTGWSWWGQGQASIWGHIAVVRPQSVGIPKLFGRYIARFETTRADLAAGRTNAKIYKAFSVMTPQGERPPANVSGTYRAWYYLPRDFKVPYGTAINIFQFKQQYALPGGGSHSDPLWWVQLSTASWAEPRAATWRTAKPARADAPVMGLNHWNNNWTHHEVYAAVPLGRWFQISADLYQGNRLVISLNGRPFQTVYASEYPVSPFHANLQAWTFGVGEYGDALAGPLYVGAASFSTPPLPAAATG